MDATNKITYAEFEKALKIVNDYKDQVEAHLKEVSIKINDSRKFVNVTKETKLSEAGVSRRLLNQLKYAIEYHSETKVSELSLISIKEFSSFRTVGRKALQELKELCFYAGIELRP